jgi:hypothetical protein
MSFSDVNSVAFTNTMDKVFDMFNSTKSSLMEARQQRSTIINVAIPVVTLALLYIVIKD